ncbi:fungal specific transcription factor domain-containing protein [Aspergillus affinis]|uniref:fungal specific transcription factor domain-containing protein n=1 Tax=Aspergillus affinis TaxID=1070780 RepID=UPI0022FEAEDF|nr:uncharacterized protein KD926_006057 [Aspergillus affinis]KAI9042138.1 hypothetical protein KD926_006057 [Aspergillus affinis]
MNDTDVRSNTRRRAVIACEYCRKRYASALPPGIQALTMKHLENAAAMESSPTNAGSSEPDLPLSTCLAQLRADVEECVVDMRIIKKQVERLVNTRNVAHSEDASLAIHTPAATLNSINRFPSGPTSSSINDSVPMTIPLGHGSTSEDLLRSQIMKAFLGDHPKDMFLKTEQNRKQSDELALKLNSRADVSEPSLEKTAAAELVNVYFAQVNPKFPILDQEAFSAIFDSTDLQGAMDTNVALVMMVLALASVSQELPDSIIGGILPASRLSGPSIQFLLQKWLSYCKTDTGLCQGLFLAASWYNFLCKPVQAWRMIHMASTNIQHVFLESDSQGAQISQDLMRLCWAIFLVECDLLAEYHLPRSGIENIIERLPYPECGPHSLDQHILPWLGNLSARRLMNRVHFTMYNTSSSGSNDHSEQILDRLLDSPNANMLFATSSELSHQLNMWWDLLPPSIKPSLDSSPDANHQDLALRFWACGDIIFRPFLYKVCSTQQGLIPDEALMEPALSCIHHCRQFLQLVLSLTKVPSPFTMIQLHSTLAVIINLTVASLCPLLAEYVSDIEELEEIAISVLKRWTCKGSSIELMLKVATALCDKRRMVNSFN